MDQISNDQAEIGIEEALVRVNQMPFPAAVVGETVKQFGHWFVLTESGWVHTEQQPN